jgi:phosphoglycerate kinase
MTPRARAPGLAGVRLVDELGIVQGARVLVRTDWNVPLRGAEILDQSRVVASHPILARLRALGAAVTVISHLGYPDGRVDPTLSLAPLAAAVRQTHPEITVLENLRFAPGEAAADPDFVARLAAGQDCFVNDAFSCMHRRHASIIGLPGLLPGAAGPLVEREVDALDRWLAKDAARALLVVGGAKVSDKLDSVAALAGRVAAVAIGGRTALPFLVLRGMAPEDQCTDHRLLDTARLAADLTELHLPIDFRVRTADGSQSLRHGGLRPGDEFVDIGPATAAAYGRLARRHGRLLWNGPLGQYETAPFDGGTAAFLTACGDVLQRAVAGGGDTTACLARLSLFTKCGHVSTGGGAMLAYLTSGELAGITALRHGSIRSPDDM